MADPVQIKDFSFAKFDAKAQKIYIDALLSGIGKTRASRMAGVSVELIRHFRIKFPEFHQQEKDAVREGAQDRNDLVENALFESATIDRNVTAQQVWLYNRRSNKWTDKRQVAGTSAMNLANLTD